MTSQDTLTLQVMSGQHLPAALRQEIIALCNRAYEEDMASLFETWSDATHLLGYCEGVLVCHALWVTRYLQAGPQPGTQPILPTAYIEAVATDAPYRNRGFAAAIMRRAVDEIQSYALAALSPFSVEYYARLGWELWQGPLFIRQDDQLLPSPADEEVMIYRLPQTPPLDLSAPLSAEWRAGEVW